MVLSPSILRPALFTASILLPMALLTPPATAQRGSAEAPPASAPAAEATDMKKVPGVKPPAMSRAADQILATWVQANNRLLVETAAIAADRAHDPEVRAFAQDVADHHRKCLAKLRQFSGAGKIPGAKSGDTPRRESVPASAGQLDHRALIVDLYRKHFETARSMLKDKKGSEFDRCYLTFQAFCDAHGIDALQVFEQHASPELGELFRKEIEALGSDKKRAHDLARQLDGVMPGMKPSKEKSQGERGSR